jgi:hypothetical protein
MSPLAIIQHINLHQALNYFRAPQEDIAFFSLPGRNPGDNRQLFRCHNEIQI